MIEDHIFFYPCESWYPCLWYPTGILWKFGLRKTCLPYDLFAEFEVLIHIFIMLPVGILVLADSLVFCTVSRTISVRLWWSSPTT